MNKEVTIDIENPKSNDVISREDALMALTREWTEITDEIIHRFIRRIKALPSVKPQDCDTCEVGNPCLYCKHKFESQESEEGTNGR